MKDVGSFKKKWFFLVEGCWKSWENPGGSKFHLVKSAVSKLRGDSSFWPHWFNQSGTLTHDWVEILSHASTLRRKDASPPWKLPEFSTSSAQRSRHKRRERKNCPSTSPTSLSIPAFTEPIEPRLLLSYNPCRKCHSNDVLTTFPFFRNRTWQVSLLWKNRPPVSTNQLEEALMFIHFFTYAQSQFSLYCISLGGH